MSAGQSRIIRELGAAVAVLAMYVLTLLVPLHQAAATQGHLSQLGYQSTAIWSVCGTASPDLSHSSTDSDVRLFVKCSTAGAGKDQLTFLVPVTSWHAARPSVALPDDVQTSSAPSDAFAHLTAEARAPPVEA